jgi:CRP-like cAMP-binding protein
VVLLSGYAYRHKVTGDGSRQIMSLHIPGDALDFQHRFLSQCDHNVQMLTRGQVAEIPSKALEDLALARPGVAEAVMVATLVEASIFREWTLNIGRRDARTRIAHLLCEFAFRLTAMRLQANGVYELPMTQEQLADATGLTAVHVNRVLGSLRAEGIIGGRNRHVYVPDWDRLTSVGDFRTNYLRCEVAAA